MRTIVLLLTLATLASCSQTSGGSGPRFVGGDGDYYQGIVAPR